MYAGFNDFHLYRVAIERAHLVGGFGKIRWIDARPSCRPCRRRRLWPRARPASSRT